MEQVAIKLPAKQHPKTELGQQILEGCQRKDRLCQKKLYEFYYGKMMAVCMRYTGNYEEARDVLHEAFMKVFQNIERFTPASSLESWVKRIVINTAIDHFRKNKHRQNQLEIDEAITLPDANSMQVLSQISADEIMQLVQQLSPSYRTVFNLYVIEGYTHREIAGLLQVSEGTSKSNLAKARHLLQQMIFKLLPEYRNLYHNEDET